MPSLLLFWSVFSPCPCSGFKLPGDYNPYSNQFIPSAEGKERMRSWHEGADYVLQVKKTDWRLKRWVGATRGDMTPVPVLLEFVDHDGKGGRHRQADMLTGTPTTDARTRHPKLTPNCGGQEPVLAPVALHRGARGRPQHDAGSAAGAPPPPMGRRRAIRC
jgi:hypothetical protein